MPRHRTVLTRAGCFDPRQECISASRWSISNWFSVLDRGPIALSNAITLNEIDGWTRPLLAIPR